MYSKFFPHYVASEWKQTVAAVRDHLAGEDKHQAQVSAALFLRLLFTDERLMSEK